MVRRRLTREFLTEVAGCYAAAVESDDHPGDAIAEAWGVPVRTAHRWVYAARQQGVMPPGNPGRADGVIGKGYLPQPLRAAIEGVLLDHELELCDGGGPNLSELAWVYREITGWTVAAER